MQKQQQEIIAKQMQNMKQSYGVGDEASQQSKDFSENDNTVGGRVKSSFAIGFTIAVVTVSYCPRKRSQDDESADKQKCVTDFTID